MPEVLTFLLIRRIPDKAHILETLRLQHIVTVPSAAELREMQQQAELCRLQDIQ